MASISRMTLGLDAVAPPQFEKFGQALLSSEMGLGEFVPTGGYKDGGADGIRVLVSEDAPSTFAQVSKDVNLEKKIRDTIAALRKAGRTVERLVYVTHLVVSKPDVVARQLEEELQLRVDIRPASWIEMSVATSTTSEAAWNRFVEPSIPAIESRSPVRLRTQSPHVQNVDALLYMQDRFDVKSRGSSAEKALDGLILWALEGTDPEAGVLRTREEIVSRIDEALPSSQLTTNLQMVQNRLDKLSAKVDGVRLINHHVAESAYCLPYETRQDLTDREAADAALEIGFKQSLTRRLIAYGLADDQVGAVAELVLEILQRALEHQGTRLAAFLTSTEAHDAEELDLPMEDVARKVINEGTDFKGQSAEVALDAAIECLRGVVYYASQLEREYLARIAQTYALFFLFDAVPSVVGYFDDVTSDFQLFVGADILIRALSEEYLESPQQTTRNMLELVVAAGANLYLTGPALNEVHHHLRNSDIEFRRVFGPAAEVVDHEFAKHSRKIMIRALYWARRQREAGKPTWEGFIHRFVDYSEVGKPRGEDQLKDYLCHQFAMAFVSETEMREDLKEDEVRALADDFSEFKSNDVLQVNDALMCMHVVRERDRRGESGARTEFGLKTWWLTDETLVRDVHLPDGRTVSHVAMRPAFLTEWLSVTPRARQVRTRFRDRFPTVQGLHITRRVDGRVFDQCMAKAREATELPEARRVAKMAALVDELKSQSRST